MTARILWLQPLEVSPAGLGSHRLCLDLGKR